MHKRFRNEMNTVHVNQLQLNYLTHIHLLISRFINLSIVTALNALTEVL